MIEIRCGFAYAPLDYAVVDESRKIILAASFFGRGSIVKYCAGQIAVANEVTITGHGRYLSMGTWERYITSIPNQKEHIFVAFMKSEEMGGYLLTDEERYLDDLYAYCMHHFDLLIEREWIPYIYGYAIDKSLIDDMNGCVMTQDENRVIRIQGRDIKASECRLLKIDLTQPVMDEIISNGLKSGNIIIKEADGRQMKPLEMKNMDEYFEKYGTVLLNNLKNSMQPVTEWSGTCKNVAVTSKRPYEIQAACINGAVALLNKQNYCVLNEGMGCGKTMQTYVTIEQYFVDRYLKTHPEKTLVDVYTDPEAINYRIIVMCPPHLVEKWKAELEQEIKYAKCIIIKDLQQLIQLKNSGKKRNGKEFYIISNEKAKLGDMQSPNPYSVKKKFPVIKYCGTCASVEKGRKVYKDGDSARCKVCGEKKWKDEIIPTYVRGLSCPNCGELLVKSTKILEADIPEDYVLQKYDFDVPKTGNQKCLNCGSKLWGSCVKNVRLDGKEPKRHWKRIKFFRNLSKKTEKTVWVHEDNVEDYLSSNSVREYSEVQVNGVRRYAPVQYIKSHMKGFFDICVLDEAHKFESESAQAHAAQLIIQASGKTIALTGTLSNGYASALFYLFWYLDPSKMVKHGYRFKKPMEFVQKYGCIETVYDDEGGEMNASSKGRVIQQPQQKPGISPQFYMDFLLENCLQMDLSDLSAFLPPLKEYVEIVPIESDIRCAYQKSLTALKKAMVEQEGFTLGATMMRFSLFYPDKPYGYDTIMSPITKDKIITVPEKLAEYEETLLNKEQRLIGIVNKELQEERNVFVYAECSGNGEGFILQRLKRILETHCDLRGRVEVLESNTTSSQKREEWMHKKAEGGTKVFICNPRLVETGLDFCWVKNGTYYNYPTIIFYQMGWNLSTLWQASYRSYRLIQKEECRLYYLAYENTAQVDVLKLMAKKKVAVSAIQGKFSAEGLANMAEGVDPRLKLAEALKENSVTDTSELEEMFKKINEEHEQQSASEQKRWGNTLLLSELLKDVETTASFSFETEIFNWESFLASEEEVYRSWESRNKKVQEGQVSLFDLFI